MSTDLTYEEFIAAYGQPPHRPGPISEAGPIRQLIDLAGCLLDEPAGTTFTADRLLLEIRSLLAADQSIDESRFLEVLTSPDPDALGGVCEVAPGRYGWR